MIFLIYLVSCFSTLFVESASHSYTHWVETTAIDELVLIEGGTERSLTSSGQRMQYFFSTNYSSDTYLMARCQNCPDGISLKIWSRPIGAYTTWITLQNEDQISLSKCFLTHRETWLHKFYNKAEAIKAFIKSLGGAKGRKPARSVIPMKGDTPTSNGPKMAFDESDYLRFLSHDSLRIPFRLTNGYKNKIKSIYIIGRDGLLYLIAGDALIVDEVEGLEYNTNPPIDSVLLRASNDSNKQVLTISTIGAYLNADFKQGGWYQLGIEIEDDESESNPYIFNFGFYDPDQLKRMFSFLD